MVSREHFQELLEKTKQKCVNTIEAEDKEFNSGTSFEDFVFEKMEEALEELDGNQENLIHRGPQKFPDITHENFGVEVKLSKKGWSSTGNSIYEGNRVDGLDEVYLLFLNQAEGDVRTRLYQECLSNVVVTHSPRYKIDMSQPANQSVFGKMDISYNEFIEKGYPTAKIKSFMRRQIDEGDDVWWLDTDETESTSVLRNFGNLSRDRKNRLRAEIMVLFPEVFSNSSQKFSRPTRYLLEEHQVICSHLRDVFTAGGREEIEVDGEAKEISQIEYKLYSLADKVQQVIKEMDKEELISEWEVESIEDKEGQWLEMIGEQTEEALTEIYSSGKEDET